MPGLAGRAVTLRAQRQDAGSFDVIIVAFWYFAEALLPLVRASSPHTRFILDSIEKTLILIGAGGVIVFLCVLAAWRIGASGAQGGGAWGGLRKWIWDTGQVTHVPQEMYFGAGLSPLAADAASKGMWVAAVARRARARRAHRAAGRRGAS